MECELAACERNPIAFVSSDGSIGNSPRFRAYINRRGCRAALPQFFFTYRSSATENHLINRAMSASGRSWIWWTMITPTVGGLLSGVLLQYVVPGARGSGIPQVKVAYAIKGGRVPFRDAIGKFLIGVLQIGTGSSLGREGPTVQICAGVASTLGRSAALSRENLRRLLPVGVAAGIAAAFNAPIAAITFTLEEVVGDLDQAVLAWIVVAAAIAAGIERAVLGEHPVFTISKHYGLEHFSSLIFYAVLGVAAAIISLIFTESLLGLRRWFQRMKLVPAWARPGVGGLVTGGLARGSDLLARHQRRHRRRIWNSFAGFVRQFGISGSSGSLRFQAGRHGFLLRKRRSRRHFRAGPIHRRDAWWCLWLLRYGTVSSRRQ